MLSKMRSRLSGKPRLAGAEHLAEGRAALTLKALLHRRDVAIAGVEFHTFHPMHGEEDRMRRHLLADLDLANEVFKGIQIDAAHGDARGRDRHDRAPKFLARLIERD